MNNKLETILQVASAGRPVKPNLRYGGTDKVIYYLDREYTHLGFNSLVAAAGDSEIIGNLIATIPKSHCLWNMNGETNPMRVSKEEHEYWSKKHFQEVLRFISQNKGIDIIHDHPGTGLLSQGTDLLQDVEIPILITLHGNFSDIYMERCLRWRDVSLIRGGVYFNAISNSQKSIFEQGGIPIESMIYHGIPLDEFPFQIDKHNYLFSLGRICPKKGQDIAIEIARKARMPLIIGGVVNSIYHDYWNEKIKPFLDFSITDIPDSKQEEYKEFLVEKLNNGEEIVQDGQIIYVGALNDRQKVAFYGRSKGFLMPIRWSEPFGLTMIESMACGTPVLAYSIGSVPEIINEGVTGYVLNKSGDERADINAMVQALENMEGFDSKACRTHVERNFSLSKEAENYINLYNDLI